MVINKIGKKKSKVFQFVLVNKKLANLNVNESLML